MDKSNIFKYATKELSQDAFLRWLFANWDSKEEDVCNASNILLKDMLGVNSNEEVSIEFVKTEAQRRKIDVLIECKFNREQHVIIIEDKTITSEHGEQLEKYKKYIRENYINHKHHFIFYKTNIMTKYEKQNIRSKDWIIYDINSIHNLFSDLKIKPQNFLLKNYVDYIEELYVELTGVLPKDISKWNMNHWHNFAMHHQWKLPIDIGQKIGNYNNQYHYFAFNIKGKWDQSPYAEIRSRDFNGGEFIFRILMHEIDKNTITNEIKSWKEKINESELFIVQNNSKQIGINEIKEVVNSIEELDELVMKYVNEFLKIFQ